MGWWDTGYRYVNIQSTFIFLREKELLIQVDEMICPGMGQKV